MKLVFIFLISILSSEPLLAFPGTKTIKLKEDIIIKPKFTKITYFTDKDYLKGYKNFLISNNKQKIESNYKSRVNTYNQLVMQLNKYNNCVRELSCPSCNPSYCDRQPLNSMPYRVNGKYMEIDEIKKELKKYEKTINRDYVAKNIPQSNIPNPNILGNHIALITFTPFIKEDNGSKSKLKESTVYCEHPFLGVSSIWRKNLGLKHKISKEYPKSIRKEIYKNIGKICENYALKGFRNFEWNFEPPYSMTRMNAFQMKKYYLKDFEDSKFILWGI